jgi:hypothetical protein
VTIPVEEPTVATATLLLLHVPPVVALASVIVDPMQTFVGPVIVPAAGLYVIVDVAEVVQAKLGTVPVAV